MFKLFESLNALTLVFVILTMSFVVAGVIAMVYGIRVWLAAEKSAAWPCVRGKIETSTFDGTKPPKGGVAYAGFRPALQYSYKVGGKTYSGNLPSFGLKYMNFLNPSYAKTRVHTGKVGDPIHVFFDPAAPERSVLIPGVTRSTLIPFLGGCLFLSFGMFFGLLFANVHAWS